VPATDAAAEPRVFLDAVLHPYRSLPPRGFVAIMLGLAALSVLCGTICVLVGAWPIFGFFGLDVALVYVAFRASYRSARQHECVRLTERSLTVEQVSVRGVRRGWRFEPFWLRVQFEETEDSNRLSLGSHGRMLQLGSFLAPVERRRFAAQLKMALARWRAFVSGATQAQ
jgi:uncharacterized membrane protein